MICKKKSVLALVANIALIVMEIAGLMLSRDGIFKYYTQDSNLVCLLVSLAYVVYWFLGKPISAWMRGLRYITTCLLMVTFIVVVTILSPSFENGYVIMLFHGSMLFHHFLCPVLSLASLIWLEDDLKLDKKWSFLALIPTIVYTLVTITLNVLKLMDGPYPFLRVYNQPIWLSCLWCVVILGGSYAIARALLWILNRKKS